MSVIGGIEEDGAEGVGSDRRKYPRYSLRCEVLLFNNEHFAEILNISSGGVACRRLVGPDEENQVFDDVDLLDCGEGRYIQGLRCRWARGRAFLLKDGQDRHHEQYCYYEFVNLSYEQNRKLRQLIDECSFSRSEATGQ